MYERYYTELIKVYWGDQKKSWQVLNKILYRKHKDTVIPHANKENFRKTGKATENDNLADKFNIHFISVGKNLSINISLPHNITFWHYLHGNYLN